MHSVSDVQSVWHVCVAVQAKTSVGAVLCGGEGGPAQCSGDRGVPSHRRLVA